jgi:maltose alpha-D-glucosyltransferase/alpha-amylase
MLFPSGEDPLWYKDAIVYELPVRAFFDVSGDGMGDFRGLTQKLDFLQDLGVTTLWLLPFSPSPWRDDGYDVADYTDVHQSYGTLRDFQHFLREAHRRGLRVITEIVVNHTSDQHPWFQRARRAPPGSKFRDFYVWSDRPDKYPDARIIFKDFELSNWSWDPVAKAYYWHRFYSHQPDLNFDNPLVREAVKEIADFWFDMGVDGFRLDAIPYLYEREGTNCENLPETHAYLRELRSYIDSHYPGRLLLAEANQWPEDAIAYFGKGDECNMAFHFPLMPRLFMAIRMEDRFPIIEIMSQTPPIPPNCQWAIFLRNHDELTLEMVTDDERDYMYRMYAHDRQMRINFGIRRRLAPLLGNDRRKIELMNALLFSMPGTPVLYYGDEIGMGDNIYLGDRNGVRTPMQWSSDRNAGFSRANPQKLYLPVIIDPEYHYEAINVEGQQNNPHSLLWWMKRIIEQRKRHQAFGRGSLEFLQLANRRVLAFIRRYDNETILVVANLSRFPQHAELELAEFKGLTPIEMFGRAPFPAIGDQQYMLTLGAHSFYWFSLESRLNRKEAMEGSGTGAEAPVIEIENWSQLLEGRAPSALMALLPGFLQTRPWFLGKSRTILSLAVVDIVAIPGSTANLSLIRVEYSEGDPDIYVMPGSLAMGDAAEKLLRDTPDRAFARVRSKDGQEGVLYSAFWDPQFAEGLLGAITRRRKIRGRFGELIGSHTRAFRQIWGPDHRLLEPSVLRADQRNTSVAFGDRFVLKMFRRIETGTNPEIEVSRFLNEHGYRNTPPVAGSIEYRSTEGEAMSLGILHGFVPNHGSAWRFTLDSLGRFFETALTRSDRLGPVPLLPLPLQVPEPVADLMGEYAEAARLMGRRTAEMHVVLASGTEPEFAPEPFTDHYRQGLYHGFIGEAGRVLAALDQALPGLPPQTQAEAKKVLDHTGEIRARFRPIRDQRFTTQRLRIHDDLNLRQMLFLGKDFVLIDFEGLPSRPYGERSIKRSPLRDVTAMVRSLHYASHAVLFGLVPGITPKPESAAAFEQWASFWSSWAGTLFLSGYLPVAAEGGFLPESQQELRTLMEIYLLSKALNEVETEICDRPDWAIIPLRGISTILGVR